MEVVANFFTAANVWLRSHCHAFVTVSNWWQSCLFSSSVLGFLLNMFAGLRKTCNMKWYLCHLYEYSICAFSYGDRTSIISIRLY